MSDRVEEIIARLDKLDDTLKIQSIAFASFQGELKATCPQHERRITELERKQRNGNGGGRQSGGMSTKVLLGLIGIISTLASALASFVMHHIAGGP